MEGVLYLKCIQSYGKFFITHKYVCLFPGKLCIEVTPQSKIVWISESLCIGCGICVKVTVATTYPLPSSYPLMPLLSCYCLLSDIGQ